MRTKEQILADWLDEDVKSISYERDWYPDERLPKVLKAMEEYSQQQIKQLRAELEAVRAERDELRGNLKKQATTLKTYTTMNDKNLREELRCLIWSFTLENINVDRFRKVDLDRIKQAIAADIEAEKDKAE